jgi:hypothetical protein
MRPRECEASLEPHHLRSAAELPGRTVYHNGNRFRGTA